MDSILNGILNTNKPKAMKIIRDENIFPMKGKEIDLDSVRSGIELDELKLISKEVNIDPSLVRFNKALVDSTLYLSSEDEPGFKPFRERLENEVLSRSSEDPYSYNIDVTDEMKMITDETTKKIEDLNDLPITDNEDGSMTIAFNYHGEVLPDDEEPKYVKDILLKQLNEIETQLNEDSNLVTLEKDVLDGKSSEVNSQYKVNNDYTLEIYERGDSEFSVTDFHLNKSDDCKERKEKVKEKDFKKMDKDEIKEVKARLVEVNNKLLNNQDNLYSNLEEMEHDPDNELKVRNWLEAKTNILKIFCSKLYMIGGILEAHSR